MSTIGTVTVNSLSYTAGSELCSWRITFDSNAGDLSLMTMSLSDSAIAGDGSSTDSSASTFTHSLINSGNGQSTVTVTEHVAGTSTVVGGFFALEFNGARSVYMPYTCEARTMKFALESLDTIGQVDVSRTTEDENYGHTWSVTFLTELGDVSALVFDNKDMTGTAVTGMVASAVVGVAPGFNSLDADNNLPLGSTIISDLSNLALTVGSLDEGIAYYFRVAAINAIGQGP
jgi:hypothetical protein